MNKTIVIRGVAVAGLAANGEQYFQHGVFFEDQYGGEFAYVWAGDGSEQYEASEHGGTIPVLRVGRCD